MRVKLTVEYDGTNYAGWQLQARQDSVQGRLEAVLEKIFERRLPVQGAGRTDAGVHACGQVAAFSAPRRMAPEALQRAINALLPRDVVVIELGEVGEDFDPRREARLRAYLYRVLNRRWPCPFDYRYAWLVRERLDLKAMQRAARLFIGEHDFSAFRTLGSQERSTRRRVFESNWSRRGNHLMYRVEASGFLRHMVRAMVAAMVEVGRGRLDTGAIEELLAASGAMRAPAPAPACGLYLVEVRY